MADQFDFDPAMFGMKANHGMLRAGQGGKEPHGSNGAHQHSAPNQYTPFGGGQRGGRGGGQRGRGRGGNRGARGGGYQAGSGGHGFQGGPSAKRQRTDHGHSRGPQGPKSFFKPSMLEDPWKHLS